MDTTFDGPALDVQSVSRSFGTVRAVDNVSFTVDPGSVVALLGPNGAGKTTTIEMCEGFIKPDAGAIRVLGLDPAVETTKVREHIGIMLQGGGSYSGVSVVESLKLAAAYSQHPHDPDWLIDLLGLHGVRRVSYRRLSGGQQQRLSLAVALINRPDLVFLDEPTAGMDAQSRRRVWDIVNALKRDGVTVVISTHLMDEAETLADNVIIMDKGTLLASGTPDELTGSADSSFSLSTDKPLDLTDLPELRCTRPLHYLAHGRPTPGDIARIAAAAHTQGVLIRSLSTDAIALEDVFLELTGTQVRS